MQSLPAAITIVERRYTAETLVHAHPHAQVVLPEVGRLDLLVGNQRGAVAQTRFAVIAPDIEHVCWADVPTCCFVVDLADPFPQALDGPAFRRVDERVRALSQLLRAEAVAGGLADPLVAESLGRYAVRTFELATGDRLVTGTGPGARVLARRVREDLDANFRDQRSLTEIAATAGASVAHIQRSFRADTGVSIVAYVQRLRLEAAEALLRTTDGTVGEIASATGFGSASYLARLFVRRFGVSPMEYRARYWSVGSGSDATRA